MSVSSKGGNLRDNIGDSLSPGACTPRLCAVSSLHQSLMKFTARLLSHAPRSRANSISFVGLGRMGSEMAYNLFSKKVAEKSDSRFVVFDAVPEVAAQFTDSFRRQFNSANITIANNPEE